MFTVRDVITEALARANLVNRRQEAPGNMLENALNLLRGIASDYSRHNLLQFLRRELVLPDQIIDEDHYILSDQYVMGVNFFIVHDIEELPPVEEALTLYHPLGYDGDRSTFSLYNPGGDIVWRRMNWQTKEQAMAHLTGDLGERAIKEFIPGGWKDKLILGIIDPEIKDDYVDVVVENLADIKEAYYEHNQLQRDLKLPFVSFEDFYNGGYGENVYTWQHISDTKVELRFTPRFTEYARSGKIRVIYNLAYAIDLDTTMKIPDIYEELFVTALTYKLAVRFPRLDPAHTERLKTTLDEIEHSVMTPTRANKMILRETGNSNNTLWSLDQLNSGSFIFPA